MSQLQGYALLVLAACLAYVLTCIFDYIERCKVNYNAKKHKNDDLYKMKIKKLHDSAFYYYYDLAINRPECLCYDLASKDINRLIKKNQINKLYTQLKATK